MIKTIIKAVGLTSVIAAPMLLSSCASTSLSPQAQAVMISSQPAAKNCRYMGMVTGNQGNFFTGQFTSNANMQQGAFNDLRNKAAQMGGNYVMLIMKQASMTEGRDSGAQTNVASTGNVYYCPDLAKPAAPMHAAHPAPAPHHSK